MSFVNFIVGVAMAAGSALVKPATTAATFFANLGMEILGASTEFFGDGSQGFLHDFTKNIQDSKARKKIAEILRNRAVKDTEYDEICREILNEISRVSDDDLKKFSKYSIEKQEKKQLKRDAKSIAALSVDILFKYDYKEVLEAKSKRFKGLVDSNDSLADFFVELITEAVKAYSEYKFHKIDDPDLKFIAPLIVSSLKEYIEDISEKNLNTIFSFIANQNGGLIDFKTVATSRYTPKYTLRACPNCGYDGDRIYIDEKSNSMHCAACGKVSTILQYCEPELWKELNEKLTNYFEQENENLNEFREVLQKNSALLVEGLEEVVTQEYFDRCFNQRSEEISELKNDTRKLEAFVENALLEYLKQIADFKQEQKEFNGNLIELIERVNESNREYNAYLSQRLESLGGQINSLYSYAREQLTGLDEKADLLLQYVENLCTKECLEDVKNALGSDLRKAITSATQKEYDKIYALTTTSVAQIMSSIDNLKELKPDKLEKVIRSENAQLSGQINGLRELIEIGTAENRKNFRMIINGQEEIKAILMASVGLNVDQDDFQKMYRGRIPSRYLLDHGWGDAFPCLYCGTKEERRLNDEQYCRCSVCGNEYYAVSPFMKAPDQEDVNCVQVVEENYGRKNDPLLATQAKVNEWRAAHTAKIEDGVLSSDQFLVILPEIIGKVLPGAYDYSNFSHSVTTLIIPPKVRECDPEFFTQFSRLQTIVFMPDSEGNYAFETGEIYVKDVNIKVFGSLYNGQQIKKYCSSKLASNRIDKKI